MNEIKLAAVEAEKSIDKNASEIPIETARPSHYQESIDQKEDGKIENKLPEDTVEKNQRKRKLEPIPYKGTLKT